jgi:prophage regulatory protein
VKEVTTDESPFLSVSQLAERYGVSVDCIWRWKRKGSFPKAYKLSSGCTRWRVADIQAHENTLETCFVERLDFQIAC